MRRRLAIVATVLMPAAMACADGMPASAPPSAGTARRAAKKRAAPPEVPPVVMGGVRYEALMNGKAQGLDQNGGHLVARDNASGAPLYTLRVYRLTYAPGMEGDKQDVFITDLSADADGRTLHVSDERGRRYRVDVQTRSVTPGP